MQSDYIAIKEEGVTNITGEMKYGMKYQTHYKTARAERSMLKGLDVNDVKLQDLKEMSTTEFAERYEKEIMQSYKTYRAQGMTAKEAGALVSNN